ncbi:uncharacterized protein PGRI_034110 [Penicillium griseofulvum]|uniref:Reverse transcriptase RNase H-like domain-containing protein n=1 Tax=Penicillium patulum TaxID=5078 RepID=A0A135L9Q6_PENPA|nr:uncharacterized protein PGRI_034110 [Penicillium griseofulvum]KXG45644.1 hypothetical protein PGRI_034110 [Penicillium griseofulvum]
MCHILKGDSDSTEELSFRLGGLIITPEEFKSFPGVIKRAGTVWHKGYAERNYWPTELEVACLVWAVRKTRHLIEDCRTPVVIYTDHSATCEIARHTHLGSSAVDKLNKRLIRASQYLSQFNLDIRHRPGKSNLVADGLSRLQYDMPHPNSDELEEIIDFDVHAFSITTVRIDDAYAEAMRKGYAVDPVLARIWTNVDDKAKAVHFVKEDDLLFFFDADGAEPLCIPATKEVDIFQENHLSLGYTTIRSKSAPL